MSKNNNNPANSISETTLPKDFKPMTQGTLRLEVPKKDGFHRHWFRGDPGRIARALKAYYKFVDPDEVDINNFDMAGDSTVSGNTDLGTRVSVVSGDDIQHSGQPSRLYLMECPEELYEESQRILAERNEDVAAALRGGKMGVDEADKAYNKEAPPNLFTPNKQRRP
jgi:hypothetical protein